MHLLTPLGRLFAPLLSLVLLLPAVTYAQLSPSAAGYVDAVAQYNVKNDGTTVTTQELQNAIDGAMGQGKALFLPAGRYLIDGPLDLRNDVDRNDQRAVIQGSSVDAANRTVIVLQAGTFPDPSNPGTMLTNHVLNTP
ncbi:MAG: glycosyl hydrolase family 28-related protein [Catalinimonas sp.]